MTESHKPSRPADTTPIEDGYDDFWLWQTDTIDDGADGPPGPPLTSGPRTYPIPAAGTAWEEVADVVALRLANDSIEEHRRLVAAVTARRRRAPAEEVRRWQEPWYVASHVEAVASRARFAAWQAALARLINRRGRADAPGVRWAYETLVDWRRRTAWDAPLHLPGLHDVYPPLAHDPTFAASPGSPHLPLSAWDEEAVLVRFLDLLAEYAVAHGEPSRTPPPLW